MKFELSARDKTVKASKWGHDFHHTEPQRRVPCAVGDLLAPASADDIAPITPEAMASVDAALVLLANLVGDRDHNLFMGNRDHDGQMTEAARQIMAVRKGLAGILRVRPATPIRRTYKCPYTAHADDCTCEGAGGGR